MPNEKCEITEATIDIQKSFDFVSDLKCGATSSFVGKVRNQTHEQKVIGIDYDIFVPLAKEILSDLCHEVYQQWSDNLKIYIAHRKGRVNVGDISVVVTVSSPHRDASFQACRYLIEGIKTRCPIWKKECYLDGTTQWLDGHALFSS